MPPTRCRRDMEEALVERLHPAITRWNRLEGRPRTHDFDRALQGRGARRAVDAHQAVAAGRVRGRRRRLAGFARACVDTSGSTTYRPRPRRGEPFDDGLPLEARSSAADAAQARAARLSLDLRLAMGRHWLKLLVARHRRRYRPTTADFSTPTRSPRPTRGRPTPTVAPHPEPGRSSAARRRARRWTAARSTAILGGARARSLLTASPDRTRRPRSAATLADAALGAGSRRCPQPPPGDDDAWHAVALEYQLRLLGARRPAAREGLRRRRVLPGPTSTGTPRRRRPATRASIQAPGRTSPASARRAVNADPRPGVVRRDAEHALVGVRGPADQLRRRRRRTTDLGKLLFIEFALVYANDWFVSPTRCRPALAASRARVTNVSASASGSSRPAPGADDDWQRWSMFTVTRRTARAPAAAEPGAAADGAQGPGGRADRGGRADPRRDGEHGLGGRAAVPLRRGCAPGIEAAREFRARLRAWSGPRAGSPASPAPIRYRGDDHRARELDPVRPRACREQRASRSCSARPCPASSTAIPNPGQVRPRTRCCGWTCPEPYYVHEEEVPRAGTRVIQGYQRTRWTNGPRRRLARRQPPSDRVGAKDRAASASMISCPPSEVPAPACAASRADSRATGRLDACVPAGTARCSRRRMTRGSPRLSAGFLQCLGRRSTIRVRRSSTMIRRKMQSETPRPVRHIPSSSSARAHDFLSMRSGT